MPPDAGGADRGPTRKFSYRAGRRPQGLAAAIDRSTLAAEIRSVTGRRVETSALDVTDAHAVPAVFAVFAAAFGSIDRVVVNAGLGKGAPLGTGRAEANPETAMTNFVGALAQIEAALEMFRRQGRGHLVLISSMSALRGMRRSMTTHAATKAGVAAIEARRTTAYVPAWPWVPIGLAMPVLPLSAVRRLT